MQKIYLFIIALAAVLVSCTGNSNKEPQKFIIEGEVADHSCDSAQIFLVPLTEPATHETVDSVVIVDGKFRFEGTKVRVASLRLQMPQRMNFQELLVYTEPGVIKAKVARNGSVTGTKTNDLIQEWKATQERCMDIRGFVYNQCNKNAQSPVFIHTVDSLNTVMADATYKLISESGLNDFTRFFYSFNKSHMTAEQLSKIKYMEDDYQHRLDSIRKVRAAENKEQNQ